MNKHLIPHFSRNCVERKKQSKNIPMKDCKQILHHPSLSSLVVAFAQVPYTSKLNLRLLKLILSNTAPTASTAAITIMPSRLRYTTQHHVIVQNVPKPLHRSLRHTQRPESSLPRGRNNWTTNSRDSTPDANCVPPASDTPF